MDRCWSGKKEVEAGNVLTDVIFCFRYFVGFRKHFFFENLGGPEQCLQKDESSRGPKVEEHGRPVGARDGFSGTLARGKGIYLLRRHLVTQNLFPSDKEQV